MTKYVFVLIAMVSLVGDAAAGPLRNRLRGQSSSPTPSYSQPAYSPASPASMGATVGGESPDALAEVNAARARRGLRPYVRDESLTQGALACARARAANFIRGHTRNDFSYLPAGASASAGGSGALEPSWGFQTCAMYDRYTYAGAAWVMGRDGRQYCQLFVR